MTWQGERHRPAGSVYTLAFPRALVIVDEAARYLETRFFDGTYAPAAPEHTPEARERAAGLGYTGEEATWAMTQDHDLFHVWLAAEDTSPCSGGWPTGCPSPPPNPTPGRRRPPSGSNAATPPGPRPCARGRPTLRSAGPRSTSGPWAGRATRTGGEYPPPVGGRVPWTRWVGLRSTRPRRTPGRPLMTEPSADEKVLAEMAADSLKGLDESLERVALEDQVAVRVSLTSGFTVKMIRARQALGRGDVRAVETLLELVDPVLRDAADQMNERMAAERAARRAEAKGDGTTDG